MLADEFPEMDTRGPRSIGGTPVTINVYVEDVDAVHGRAIAQGAKEIRPVENQFYGDRSGQFEDPFGHRWNVSTHVEDVPPEEMQRRSQEAMEAMGSNPPTTARPGAGELPDQKADQRRTDILGTRHTHPNHLAQADIGTSNPPLITSCRRESAGRSCTDVGSALPGARTKGEGGPSGFVGSGTNVTLIVSSRFVGS